MKKALIISNKIRVIPGGSIETIIEPLTTRGFEVVWAANFNTLKIDKSEFPCKILETESETNPFSKHNITTKKIINNFLKNNKVDLIFCSTPIGGLFGRLCGKRASVPIVIYQAHGFLFFNGGPKLGFIFKWYERFLAHYTDALITINKEDYASAKAFKLKKNGRVFLVNGSGEKYESSPISESEKCDLRKTIGLRDDDYIFISIGELNKNKNVIATVKAFFKSFGNKITICKLLICGEGKESEKIRKFIRKHNIEKQVLLLGYRKDVRSLLQISNCYVSTSLREGLSRTVGESMAAGLPCIVSNKRGLVDLIDDNKGGYIFNPKDVKDISKKMLLIYSQKNNDVFGVYNKRKIKEFSSFVVKKQMESILDEVLK